MGCLNNRLIRISSQEPRYVSDGDKQILRLCNTTVDLLYSVAPVAQCKLLFNPQNPRKHSATKYNVGQQGLTHDTG